MLAHHEQKFDASRKRRITTYLCDGKRLAKLRLKPTRHDPALVKQNKRFVKIDSSAKLSGK
uniref:Uncharacterized protein n=1 Tax=Candidatus Kentrum sp. LFY TaxID=2126342 RepID=A0A450U7W5_9GAMM|nr:MAG: hypothetical protein BECKLFY1418A_GA0070994_100312 [Candidatus Kentron sp. LFY]